ncbi:MAG: D-inositol 3-phosphate glycosyltransferase [Dehalococcoidia bacterium]|jgi:glycosyltransferase involved in cell wall biosynthesis|nr:MAG: D-inositol 3-phosphate glycosyltransferase [Dehalococcoidia bacterium]
MRILMLCSQITGETGSFARTAALGRCLQHRGHEVTILTASPRPGVGVHPVNGACPRVLEAGGLAPRKVRSMGLDPTELINRIAGVTADVDVVHVFSHRPTVAGHVAWFRRRRIPVLYDWADLVGRGGLASNRRDPLGRLLGVIDDWLERAMVRSADGITAITTFLAKRAVSQGIAPTAVWHIPAGADVSGITPQDRRLARQAIGLPVDSTIVGFAGFHRWDADLVADTLAHMFPRNPALIFTAAGPAAGFIQRRLHPRWRSRMVRFPALYGLDYVRWLASADVLLLPYPHRSYNVARFPNKLGDYLAAGRAIVTNRTGDMGAMLDGSGAALLVGESPQELAEGISRCLADSQLRESLERQSREFAETAFRWDMVAARLETAYAETIVRVGA